MIDTADSEHCNSYSYILIASSVRNPRVERRVSKGAKGDPPKPSTQTQTRTQPPSRKATSRISLIEEAVPPPALAPAADKVGLAACGSGDTTVCLGLLYFGLSSSALGFPSRRDTTV